MRAPPRRSFPILRCCRNSSATRCGLRCWSRGGGCGRWRLCGCFPLLPPLWPAPSRPPSPRSARPRYRGRIACMEISLATVIALALCGRRAHLVLGARQLPTEAHAWVWTENGAFGLSGRNRPDPRRPWVGALATPPVPHARKGEL
ncbi:MULTISPECIES: lasso peptide biosynthesis B2 protein [Streptomyces]|uniref:lasso peptide biosynthesis B2 protein n=1 Tax=Streptomyces TaxID=1883 RepID=UPI0033E03CC4